MSLSDAEAYGQVEEGGAVMDLLHATACAHGNAAPTCGLGSSSRDVAPSVSSRQRAPHLGGLLNIACQGVHAVREDTRCLDWSDLGVTSWLSSAGSNSIPYSYMWIRALQSLSLVLTHGSVVVVALAQVVG